MITGKAARIKPIKFYEFRRNGWPYCPLCGEDELASKLCLGWVEDSTPSLRACLDGEFFCYECNWDSEFHGQPVR